LMYFIVLINLVYFIIIDSLKIPKILIYILLYLCIDSIISIIFYNNNLSKILFQFFGITIMSLYYYNFFSYCKYSVRNIFLTYCAYAFIVSIIGLFFFLVTLILKVDVNMLLSKYIPFYGYPYDSSAGPLLKVRGLLLEPAHFGGIILPALTYLIIHYKKHLYKLLVVSSAIILTFSSVTYIGILFMLILIQKKISAFKLIFVTAFSILLGLVAYNSVEGFKIRFDDTTNVLSDSDFNFEGVNLSTYALLSNLYVTTKVFNSNPLTGHGLGSHPLSHALYISDLVGTDTFELLGLDDINSTDANSFFLRVVSELGLIGLILIFLFLKKNYSISNSDISKAILVYFFYKLIRDGHYFPPELYFFVFAYYFLKKEESQEYNKKIFS
jgi:hypothetical protein